MSFQENGLDISIFPPKGESIAPNNKSTITVIIENQKHENGVQLQVSLALNSQLQKWCKNPSQKITISHQQSQEVKFSWKIPIEAPPGTYYYNLRIEFLRSTSFYSFQPKRRQLTVLVPQIKPQVNDNIEPSFNITPASSSTQPITLSPRGTVNLEIDVHNRSKKVDDFRISTDLEANWYTIHYPESIKRVGAIDGNNTLSLNPNKEGKIYLNINPPADIVAGNYKPEIKLHSLNSPELFLKKIVYLHIPPQYSLQAELQSILNKVSYKKGQYKIILTNQGNTFRTIEIDAKSSDEDEHCEYFLEPSSVRIAPNKTIEANLEVQPKSKQKRPFLRTKQFNFQLDLIDKNNQPLPKNLPLKGILHWRSRPLWQLILLLIVALGLVGGVAWLIWEILKPEPVKITLKAEKTDIIYNPQKSANVAVNWTVQNYNNIENLMIFDKERPEDRINTRCYYFDENINKNNCTLINQNNLPRNCNIQNNTVGCSNVIFYHAQDLKNYTFKLQAFKKKGKTIEKETEEPIKILPRPTLEVFEPLKISPIKSKYSPNDPLKLTFEVSDIKKHFVEEDRVFLLINGERQKPAIISQQNISDYCSPSISDRYLCYSNTTIAEDGKHTLGIELQYNSDGRIDNKPKRYTIPEPIIVQTPIKLEYFKINNSDSGTLEVEADTQIIVSWSVKGKNAQVNIDCLGGQLGLKDRRNLNVAEGITQRCTLEISNEEGKAILKRTLGVKVKERPKPQPPSPPPVIIQDPDSELLLN